MKSNWKFDGALWDPITDDAKDLITNLIQRQADMRYTAQEAFNSPWIQKQRKKHEQGFTIGPEVLNNVREHISSLQFKRTTLLLIASRIPEDQITELREAFSKFDKNGDGTLSLKEIKEGISKVKGVSIPIDDIEKIMSVMDSNQNGTIDYTEFIAACLSSYNYMEEHYLKIAFNHFDKDGNGKISKDELAYSLS